MNPKFETILDIMKKYDNSQIGSIERSKFGEQIENLHKKLKIKDKDILSIKYEYEKRNFKREVK